MSNIKNFIYEKEDVLEIELEVDFSKKRVRTGGWMTDFCGNRVSRTEEVVDEEHIIADDWSTIPAYCCKKCKRPIIKYDTVFQGREYFGGSVTKRIFSQRNGYCRICALKLAKKWNKSYSTPNYIKYPDEHGDETMYFLDEKGFPTGEKIEYNPSAPSIPYTKVCDR